MLRDTTGIILSSSRRRCGSSSDRSNSTCVLTFRVASGGFLEDGVPGCGGAFAAFGPSGAWPGGFWWPGGRTGKRGQAAEIPADPAGAEFSLQAAAFPALAVVCGDGAGEAELGDGAED